MKHILPLLSLLALPLSAQQYQVNGTAPKGTKHVVMYNLEVRNGRALKADTLTVDAQGKFSTKGNADGKLFGVVSVQKGNEHVSQPVFLDGTVSVDLTKPTSAGSKENEQLSAWNARLNQVKAPIQAIQREVMSYREKNQQMPDSVKERINATYEKTMGSVEALVKECCAKHSADRFPAYFFDMVYTQMPKTEVLAIIDQNPAFMQTSLMNRVKKRAEGWRRTLPGTPFTDLALPDSTGRSHQLAEFVKKGRYTLIDFWASWCGPCRMEMPNVKAAYEKYHAKGFDVVGLSFDTDRTAWLAALKKLGMTWPQLSDLKGWQSAAAATYGIDAIPATVLVGPDGKIITTDLRGEALDKKLEELLK